MRRASFWMVWDQGRHGMKKVKKLLCIHPKPAKLCIRVSAFLNRRGGAVESIRVDIPTLSDDRSRDPAWRDRILCDKRIFASLASHFAENPRQLDASLIPNDVDRLVMVCERKRQVSRKRKPLCDACHAVPLLEAGGLMLGYQPTVSFRAAIEHRSTFEAGVRLTSGQGLPAPVTHRWSRASQAQAGYSGYRASWRRRRARAAGADAIQGCSTS